MNQPDARIDATEAQLWQMVPLADHQRPARPATVAVRSGLFGLFKRNRQETPEAQVIAEEKLRQPSEDLLNTLAGWPDWRDAIPALEQTLTDIMTPDAGSRRIRVVVGAPYSGTRETVRSWAAQRQWAVVEPPTPERILAQDESWLDAIAGDDGPPLVIAELEQCMLRHPFGLAFLRRLLDRLRASPRRCLVATNSWTWAYLTAAMRIGDGMADPVTLQAFDADRLAQWFGQLVRCDAPVLFRQANDGARVLTSASKAGADPAADTQPPGKRSDFLACLAGYSRGIAGVAWGIWRQSLEAALSEEVAVRHAESDSAAKQAVIWVRPWSQIHHRDLPADAGLDALLVLHVLLIHGGLPAGAVSAVLAALGARVPAVLRSLAAHGIVEEHQGRWQVTPVGYPAAREALESEGLLVDWL
jgi:hypothetical protein